MNGWREWAARWSHAWLERFRHRYGLATPADNGARAFRQQLQVDRGGERVLLHVGCGHATIDQIVVPGFHKPGWHEIRLDADPRVAPDVVGTMADMHAIADGSVDAVFTSHGIEHLYWHEVPVALAEFHRVLASEGFVVITCPDVQAAAQMIAEDRMFETAYVSAAGPITPFDILYSYRPFVEACPQWMSHHCGFTLSTLTGVLREAGFAAVHGFRQPRGFALWVLAVKPQRTTEEMAALAGEFLPAAA